MGNDQKQMITVRTLGTQEVLLGDRPLKWKTSAAGKTMQLFFLLALSGNDGVSRHSLQDALFDRQKTDAGNALRIAASRLRKQMKDAGFPEQEYVTVHQNRYFLSNTFSDRGGGRSPNPGRCPLYGAAL